MADSNNHLKFAQLITKNLETMDNKILFEETYKTFDQMRQSRYLSLDDPNAWDEDDVTTLMYDVAIIARNVVLKSVFEKLKSSLTDEQLKPVLDALSDGGIQERPTPVAKKKIRKRRIRDLDISTRAKNCLYMNDVFTTDDLLYGKFLLKRFRMARNVGKVTLKEVEDLIARLKNEENDD